MVVMKFLQATIDIDQYIIIINLKSKIFKNTDFKTKYKILTDFQLKTLAIYIYLSVSKIYLKMQKKFIKILIKLLKKISVKFLIIH